MRMRYDRPDVKAVFRVLIVALAVAVAAAPLVLDGCLIACAPGTASVIQSPQTEHACHHRAGASRPSLRDAATPCGHDHRQSGAMTSAVSPSDSSLKIARTLAAHVPATSVSIGARGAFESPPAPSTPTLGSLPSLTLPLRV